MRNDKRQNWREDRRPEQVAFANRLKKFEDAIKPHVDDLRQFEEILRNNNLESKEDIANIKKKTITPIVLRELEISKNSFEEAVQFYNHTGTQGLNTESINKAFIQIAIATGFFQTDLVAIYLKTYVDVTPNELPDEKMKLACKTAIKSEIITAGQLKNIVAAKKAYEDAKKAGLVDVEIYITFIKVARGLDRFEEAKAAYEEVKKVGLANNETHSEFKMAISREIVRAGKDEDKVRALVRAKAAYQLTKNELELYDVVIENTFITTLGKLGKFAEAKETYDAIPKDKRDEVTYAALIEAADQLANKADRESNFPVAREAYYEGKTSEKIDWVTYLVFTRLAGRLGYFEEAKAAYMEARELELTNGVTRQAFKMAISQEIVNAGKDKDKVRALARAEAAYQLTKNKLGDDNDLADVVIHNSLITLAGNLDDFPRAETAYKATKKAKLANFVTYNVFIRLAGRLGYFEEAKAAYNEAKRLELANDETRKAFKMAISREIVNAGKEKDIARAKAAYQLTKNELGDDNELADVVISNSLITVAGNLDDFPEAKAAYKAVRAEQCAARANVVTYNIFIKVAGTLGHFDAAKAAYNEAKGLGLANDETIQAFKRAISEEIVRAGTGKVKVRALVRAKAAYNLAKNELADDVMIYKAFITVADKLDDFPAAKTAYEAAKKAKVANVETYNAFIKVAHRLGYSEEAKAAYNEANRLGLANLMTLNAFNGAKKNSGNTKSQNSANNRQRFFRNRQLKNAQNGIGAQQTERRMGPR